MKKKLNPAILVISCCCFCMLISCGNHPGIVISTAEGDIFIELYPEQAPLTVENFLRYVDEGRLTEAVFYRTVTMDNQPDNDVMIEVIQGGIWWTDSLSMLDPIEHETTKATGILHLDGTISMARYTPGTATSEFFICVGDQPSLDYGGTRNGDGQGFAAFGRVVKGMDAVRRIHASPCDGQQLTPFIKINYVQREE